MISWTRVHRGWYEGTDELGQRWRIVQETSRAWQTLLSNGSRYEDDGPRWWTLADAKDHAEGNGMVGHYERKARIGFGKKKQEAAA